MKYHLLRISNGKTEYLSDYSKESNYGEIWSTDPDDWREFSKIEAKGVRKNLRSRGIETELEKSLV